MTTNDIDAIRKLADAATRGPWEHGGGDGLVWGPTIGDPVSGSTEPEDAEFIAAARTLVPALCAEVEQLRAHTAALNDKLDAAWKALRGVHLTGEMPTTLAGMITALSAALTDTRAALDHANRELAGTRADLASAVKANTAWANQAATDHRRIGREALTEYRDANHRHNDRAPGWCICGDDWDDEGCTEYVGLTEAAQLYGAEAVAR